MIPLELATKIAEELTAQIADKTEQIMIVGSVRRRKANVKDIDLVCIPKKHRQVFGDNDYYHNAVHHALHNESIMYAWPRQLVMQYQNQPVDIYFATPENWGYIVALRTGPKEFSRRLVSETSPSSTYGLKPRQYQCNDGYVWLKTNLIDAPAIVPIRSEQELFDLWDIEYIEPHNRAQ